MFTLVVAVVAVVVVVVAAVVVSSLSVLRVSNCRLCGLICDPLLLLLFLLPFLLRLGFHHAASIQCLSLFEQTMRSQRSPLLSANNA